MTPADLRVAELEDQCEGFAARLSACRETLAAIVDLVLPDAAQWTHAEVIAAVARAVADRDTLRRLVDETRARLGADSLESLGTAAGRVVERAAGLVLQVSGKQERIDALEVDVGAWRSAAGHVGNFRAENQRQRTRIGELEVGLCDACGRLLNDWIPHDADAHHREPVLRLLALASGAA